MYRTAIASALRARSRTTHAAGTTLLTRAMSSGGSLVRPAPPPLPREQQREFEELVRAAQAPLSTKGSSAAEQEAEIAMHPDARAPLQAEFDGDTNPVTGEQGGPKREPVNPEWGDWSFKGRVTDF